jgi:hypothetical protein
MSKKTISITIWVIFLAMVGVIISAKGPMTTQDMLRGALIGGSIGYFIGILLNLNSK